MIDKFGSEELKTLMKLHSSVLYQWASTPGPNVTHELKEHLLGAVSRLYELVEQLPEKPQKEIND